MTTGNRLSVLSSLNIKWANQFTKNELVRQQLEGNISMCSYFIKLHIQATRQLLLNDLVTLQLHELKFQVVYFEHRFA